MQKIPFRLVLSGALLLTLTAPMLAQPRDNRGPRDGRGGPPRDGRRDGRGPDDGPRRGPRAKGRLMGLWHELAAMETGKTPLSRAQAEKIAALVLPVSRQSALSDADAQKLGDQIEAVLTDAQRAQLRDHRPPRNGRGPGGQTFLRGAQMTDEAGVARFTTIYPGWYRGRTAHIHFKIRASSPNGGTYEFTSQLFFDDDVSDVVYTQSAYKRNARRDQTNARDGIFREGGDGLILDLKPAGDGFKAAFDVGLDLSQPARGRGKGPGRGGFGRWGDD